MNSKLFVVVTVFLFVLLVNAKSGSEESTSAEMKEAIDALLHQHTKHNRRSCGAGAVFKIMELCPNLCTISDGVWIIMPTVVLFALWNKLALPPKISEKYWEASNKCRGDLSFEDQKKVALD
ncbi:hypothetical protein L3Y34_018487 [Caenorhabditis briggsae]|uniref:Uncharacterized protein n=1 Tax=Caenorhabditis briggsae TaxID=6238 RepID=A0AAE9IUQ9_CAEBR|nr:hypothetical protein L3Y34_018487 [Caenorhabditis briggsae]